MVKDSHKASYVPEPQHVRRFFERSNELAQSCENEKAWHEGITTAALNRLKIDC
jgi:hypothetical protein